MRTICQLLLLFSLAIGCARYVPKPDNLLDKKEMAEILAELSLNESLLSINPQGNMQEGVLYILKQHHTTGKAFSESYEFYLANKQLPGIIEDAQEILLEKDPAAAAQIKKNNTTGVMPNPNP